uniref:Ashwin n=1 Tax=Mesocestoides corti TaxID=53468 RepID=A0A5K3G1U5_MESCO
MYVGMGGFIGAKAYPCVPSRFYMMVVRTSQAQRFSQASLDGINSASRHTSGFRYIEFGDCQPLHPASARVEVACPCHHGLLIFSVVSLEKSKGLFRLNSNGLFFCVMVCLDTQSSTRCCKLSRIDSSHDELQKLRMCLSHRSCPLVAIADVEVQAKALTNDVSNLSVSSSNGDTTMEMIRAYLPPNQRLSPPHQN